MGAGADGAFRALRVVGAVGEEQAASVRDVSVSTIRVEARRNMGHLREGGGGQHRRFGPLQARNNGPERPFATTFVHPHPAC
jgi:hypothetical protein